MIDNTNEVKLELASIDGKLYYTGELVDSIDSWDTRISKKALGSYSIERMALSYVKRMTKSTTWSGMMKELMTSSTEVNTSAHVMPLMMEIRKTLSGGSKRRKKPKETSNESAINSLKADIAKLLSKGKEEKTDNLPPKKKREILDAVYKPLKAYVWQALKLSRGWFEETLPKNDFKDLKWFNCSPYLSSYHAVYETLTLNELLKSVTVGMLKSLKNLTSIISILKRIHKIDLASGAYGEVVDATTYGAFKEYTLKSNPTEFAKILVEKYKGVLTETEIAVSAIAVKRRESYVPKNKTTNN